MEKINCLCCGEKLQQGLYFVRITNEHFICENCIDSLAAVIEDLRQNPVSDNYFIRSE